MGIQPPDSCSLLHLCPMLRVRFPFLSKFFSERDKSRQAGGHLRREERRGAPQGPDGYLQAPTGSSHLSVRAKDTILPKVNAGRDEQSNTKWNIHPDRQIYFNSWSLQYSFLLKYSRCNVLHTLSDASLSPSLFNMLQHLLYIATKALKISLWLASKVF